ncbi:mobile element protein [Vibrio ponticus]|nr:mobile element protein [Vibrio ponticus]
MTNQSVTLLVKVFYGADLLLSLQKSGHNRHWLLPAKKGLKYTLLDNEESNDMVAEFYHESWEIELGYRDIKSSMLHNALVYKK